MHTKLRNGAKETFTTQYFTVIGNDASNARKSIYSQLPITRIDVQDALDSVVVKTSKNENFLLVNNRNLNLISFSTIMNLKSFSKLTTLFIDGTFYSCPKHFTQVFTIHALSQKNLTFAPQRIILILKL